MAKNVSSQSSIDLIRLMLGKDLAGDFDRAVRHRGVMLEKRKIKPRTSEEWRTFRDEVRAKKAEATTILYHCWPGVGKTTRVADLAEANGEKCPTIVFGLSHKAYSNFEYRSVTWAHWKGHEEPCQIPRRARKGYTSEWHDCDCGANGSRLTSGPTFAPIEYALSDEPNGPPLAIETLDYTLWVFDERFCNIKPLGVREQLYPNLITILVRTVIPPKTQPWL